MTLGWTIETLWQMALLAGLAVAVPLLLYRFHGPSLLSLAVNLLVSALVLVALAAGLFGLLYAQQGLPVEGQVTAHVLRLGLSSSIVWLPVLLLVGLRLGTLSEARAAKAREASEAARLRPQPAIRSWRDERS